MNLHSHSISSLQGVLTVPGDKSISHRAAILGGLAEGVTEVDNFLCSEDCLNTLRAMEQLGAKVDVLEERQGYGPVRFRIHPVDIIAFIYVTAGLQLGRIDTVGRMGHP